MHDTGHPEKGNKMNEDSLSHRQTKWTLGNKPICQVYWVEHLCGGESKIWKEMTFYFLGKMLMLWR